MIPGYWLNEGGQSATGALIDHMITSHPLYENAKELADKQGKTVYQLLNDRLLELAGNKEDIAFLTKISMFCLTSMATAHRERMLI